jgi:hypothetical protein
LDLQLFHEHYFTNNTYIYIHKMTC